MKTNHRFLSAFLGFSLLFSALGVEAAPASAEPEKNDPLADPAAVVVCGNARFTVLTDRLIRMEWSEDGKFEDHATLAVINRKLPVPSFKKSVSKNAVTLRTDALTLKYKGPGKFDKKNLFVEFSMPAGKKARKVKWTPGADESGNLMGTFRTLDGSKGFEQINGKGDPYEKGILSRDGWAIVDESARHLLISDDSDWENWVAERPSGERIDWYIFAYGHDYKGALADFTKVSGRIPLPPKYVFGYWWSRYWQYSDFEFLDLGKEIRSHNIPMDVMVIDMDWHDVWTLHRKDSPKDEFGERIGWTGYTWQKQLFPDPAYTLGKLHRMHLRTSLNLHPASGIQPYEDCYEPFVKDYLSRTDDYDGPKGYVSEEGDSLLYLRSNPKTKSDRLAKADEKAPVPFRADQRAWADAYFNSVIHPMERQGVDFWWLDWQQWKQSEYVPGLSNTFWLNHIFFNDKIRQSKSQGLAAARPLIYHRWGGLGSHRYQIGFSGDCHDTWEVLKFLPYFTATSSNVGYGYWGHDMGGHQVLKGTDPYKPEVFTRWIQNGVFMPIFKTHSTKSSVIERRVWNYSPEYAGPMRAAIRLRYSLSLYIYDAARAAYDTGVSLCRPMYYDYPEAEQAYAMKEQYLFGEEILATAVCQPMDTQTGLSTREVWFPEGDDWYDMATGKIYKGGQTLSLQYTLNENPWYVKAGSILPLAGENISSLQEQSNELRIFIAPGDGQSEYLHYEDDGLSQAYCRDFATTKISKTSSSESCRVDIGAREGSFEGMEPTRRLSVLLEGVFFPSEVTVDGVSVPYTRFPEDTPDKASWNYVGKDLAVVVTLPEAAADKAVTVECKYDVKALAQNAGASEVPSAELLRGKKGLFHRMMDYTPVLKDVYNTCIDPYMILCRPFLKVAQCASYIDAKPEMMVSYLQNIDFKAIEEDLENEAQGLVDKAAKKDMPKVERKVERIRAASSAIQAQSKL